MFIVDKDELTAELESCFNKITQKSDVNILFLDTAMISITITLAGRLLDAAITAETVNLSIITLTVVLKMLLSSKTIIFRKNKFKQNK